MQLLLEDAFPIIFNFDIRAILDCERVLRVEVVDDVGVDASVFLNVWLVFDVASHDVLVEAMLLVL